MQIFFPVKLIIQFFVSSSSSSATAFPFNNVENHGAHQDSGTGSSSSNGSVPDTPEVLISGNRFPETGLPLENKKQKQKKLVTTPTTTVVNITRLPCLPERSTYPVELAESLPMSKFLKRLLLVLYGKNEFSIISLKRTFVFF